MQIVHCLLLVGAIAPGLVSTSYSAEKMTSPSADYYVLTPPPAATPRINSARVFGVRPGSVFLFTVAATGEAPIHFSAEGLPAGLSLDSATGRITGTIEDRAPQTYRVQLSARNARGEAKRELRIVVGDRVALTPPLGWNSWNSWAAAVDDAKVRATAVAMAEKLKAHGWVYVNIDDTWQGARGGPLRAIQPNQKFPDMKKLADDVHALGLKLGIYSTPWMTSYAGHVGGSADNPEGAWEKPVGREATRASRKVGSFGFAEADARQWAEWGIDYLKYDWFPNDVPATKTMAQALAAQPRDIVYSLSNTAPFDHAAAFTELTQAWRTTGDIRDVWDNASKSERGYQGVLNIWRLHEKWAPFAGPGHWPDPDMLVVGKVGWGPKLHPSNLTADEQYTHISLWCLWSAPMLIGCPIEDMDDFTLNLLTNDEVLEVNQDPLGRMARPVIDDGDRQVLAKPMEDGSWAIGLFNLGASATEVTVPWSAIEQAGPLQVRDLWRQKNLGTLPDKFSATVPSHGVVLVRVRRADSSQ